MREDKIISRELQLIYGIGDNGVKRILGEMGLNGNKRINRMKKEDIRRVNEIIKEGYKVEGEKRKEERDNISRLKEMRHYKGERHKKGLPVNGQRTHSNGKTRKRESRVCK